MSDNPTDEQRWARLARAVSDLHGASEIASLDRTAEALVAQFSGATAVGVVRATGGLDRWDRTSLDDSFGSDAVDVGDVLDRTHVGPSADGDAPAPLVVGDRSVAAPVVTRAGVVGALVVAGGPSTDEACRAAAEVVARHLGTATARLWTEAAGRHQFERVQRAFEDRAAVATALQRSLLPPRLPIVPHVLLGAAYRPMTEEIGGDFYDVFPMRDDSWGLVLGDVCGKGAAAASITALARNSVRTVILDAVEPTGAVRTLNRLLVAEREDEQSALCTAIVGRVVLDERGVNLDLAVAGHPSPVVLRADGGSDTVAQTGPMLGIWDTVDVGSTTVTLRPGDACVLYTDGATDVRDADGVEFGEERLHQVIEGCRDLAPDAMAKAIEHAVVDYQRGDVRDDLAVLVVAAPRF